MAKRGRPRKTKPPKKRVGRPKLGRELTVKEVELIREWNYLNYNRNYTALEKKKIICAEKFVSIAKLEKAIALFNKLKRLGIICSVPPDYAPSEYVVMFPCHKSIPANDYATIRIVELSKITIKSAN